MEAFPAYPGGWASVWDRVGVEEETQWGKFLIAFYYYYYYLDVSVIFNVVIRSGLRLCKNLRGIKCTSKIIFPFTRFLSSFLLFIIDKKKNLVRQRRKTSPLAVPLPSAMYPSVDHPSTVSVLTRSSPNRWRCDALGGLELVA